MSSSNFNFFVSNSFSDSFNNVVATAVTILTILPSTKVIHLETLIDIVFFVKINSFLDTWFLGIILIIPGFNAVTIGVCHGKTVTSPISVGKVICLISHSNIILAGLEIFNFMIVYQI
jgi:hypothetical protein